MTTNKDSPLPTVRVAWLLGTDLRPYRIPFLQRLGRRSDIDVVCFHGAPRSNTGAPTNRVAQPRGEFVTRRVVNRHWPAGRHRVAWQSGVGRLLQEDFEVIVCPDHIHNLSVWFLAVTHRMRKRKLVFFGYGYRPQWSGITGTLKLRLRKLLLRSADAAIAYTERGRHGYMKAGIPEDRVFVSNNTLDTEWLTELGSEVSEAETAELREVLNPRQGPTLLFVGRLLPEKRVDVLAEAFRLVKHSMPDAALLVVGDGPVKEALRGLSTSNDSVRMLGAIYDERRLARLFMLADVLVVPGRIGLTCVHGFAYGVPPVTTTDELVPQSPEFDYIVDGVNGIVSPSLDPIALADAIVSLLKDGRRLEAMKAEALLTAKRLRMDGMVEAFAGAVHRVVR